MRILLVNSHGSDRRYGGAERYVRDLSVGFRARGHEVEVLSAFPPQDEDRPDTHVLHRSDWRDNPRRRVRNHLDDILAAPWPRFRALLQAATPDLVHTNNLPGIATGIWESARRLDIPVVQTLHDYQLLCPRTSLIRRDGTPCNPSPFICGARTRRLTRWAGAVGVVIGVSEHVLRRHEGFFATGAHCVVRPPLAPLARPLRPPKTPPVTLGYLGRLSETKGVRLLLAAAGALARQGFALRIAGDGPLRSEVEAADNVRYEGHVEGPGLIAFMEECDVGVIPSLWDEPGPIVVREWFAAGRPVLATHRGGLAEAAQRGGVMSFDESTAALINAAVRLRDKDEWSRILATLPTLDGSADVERWLDEHQTAYAIAQGLRTPS